jgi:hypothetical protein
MLSFVTLVSRHPYLVIYGYGAIHIHLVGHFCNQGHILFVHIGLYWVRYCLVPGLVESLVGL